MPSSPSPAVADGWTPLSFLAALGAGGLAVAFFMWPMFWIDHPGRPAPVFEDVMAAFAAGGPALDAALWVALGGVGVFAALHVALLIGALSAWARWRGTEAARRLRTSNAETQMLAAPLTVAMSINVGFILGLLFVPGLWSMVELLFPMALAAFLLVGVWALRLTAAFWARVLGEGGFDVDANASFAQLLPAFALAMVAVGLAAPAAMSGTDWVVALSFVASRFFLIAAGVVAAVKLFLGMREMMRHGVAVESAPTLWIAIPILTVAAIALMRASHGAHGHLGGEETPFETFLLLTNVLAAQLVFGLMGWVVLKRVRYFERFVDGPEVSVGSWALVCPGVALTVLLHFFANKGLVGVGLAARFDPLWWTVTGAALAVHAATILLVLKLLAKHHGRAFRRAAGAPAATPAE